VIGSPVSSLSSQGHVFSPSYAAIPDVQSQLLRFGQHEELPGVLEEIQEDLRRDAVPCDLEKPESAAGSVDSANHIVSLRSLNRRAEQGADVDDRDRRLVGLYIVAGRELSVRYVQEMAKHRKQRS
jgi:hypothetical protein